MRYPNNKFSYKKCLVSLPIIFAVLYNIPKFFEFVTCHDTFPQALQINSSVPNVSSNVQSMHDQKNVVDNYITPVNWKNATLSFDDIQRLLNETYLNRKTVSVDNVTNLNNKVGCREEEYGVTRLRKNRWYIIFYVFGSDFLFVKILPWLVIITLNLLTWRHIRRFQKNRKRFMRTPFQGKRVLMKMASASELNFVLYICLHMYATKGKKLFHSIFRKRYFSTNKSIDWTSCRFCFLPMLHNCS